MPEDRSLDEFGGSDGDPPDAEPIGIDPDADPADVEAPVPATATWTIGGADCERCGESVTRRWLDDGDRVCPDCKSW